MNSQQTHIIMHSNQNYGNQQQQRRSFSPSDNPITQARTQQQMAMSFGNLQINPDQQQQQQQQLLQQQHQQNHQGIIQDMDNNQNEEYQYGMSQQIQQIQIQQQQQQQQLQNRGQQRWVNNSNQNSSSSGNNNSQQTGQISSIQNNNSNNIGNMSDQMGLQPLVNYNLQDDINQFASVQSFSPNLNRVYVDEQKFQITSNQTMNNQLNKPNVVDFSMQDQTHSPSFLNPNNNSSNDSNLIKIKNNSNKPLEQNIQQYEDQQIQQQQQQQVLQQQPNNQGIRTTNNSHATYSTMQTLPNIQNQQNTINGYPLTKIQQNNNILHNNQEILIERKKIDSLIEQNSLLYNQIEILQKSSEIKDKALQNTYNIAFLQSKDENIDFMKILEAYVLICAENEKLSFGFIEKLQKMDELNVEISELLQQKEDWKTLYEGKCNELTSIQMQSNSIRQRDDQLIKLIEENDKLRSDLQREIRLKEEQQNQINEEQQSMQQNLPEVNMKVCDLEDKLIKILDENQQLNELLRERVYEVEYLQNTIKQIQETFQEQNASDHRFTKVIKDLESEIRRMDERMEELIKEKEKEISNRVGIEEENNNLRMQYQLKRQELEEYKISSATQYSSEISVKKKQEQIDDLLLKLEQAQRNLSELQEQKETHLYEAKSAKESYIKLEKRYTDKTHENMDLLQKNTELQHLIKNLKEQKDQVFLEKDLKQLSFEKKQLEITLNEQQYENDRIKQQLDSTRKEIDSLNKQILVQRQKQSEIELQYQDEIDKLKQEQFKESENYRFKARIEVQDDVISTLKTKLSHLEDKLNEKTLEIEEQKLLIKEQKTKLERTSMIETTLHNVDKEYQILVQHKEEAINTIQALQQRILVISIENERLHRVMEEMNNKLQQYEDKLENQDKFNNIEISRMEEEMKVERIQFQEVIRNLEQQLKDIEVKFNAQYAEEKQQFITVSNEYTALQQEFQLAIETLKAKDQQLFHIENQYNLLLNGDRNTYIINKLEEKLSILSAENFRLNKIIVDRIRHSNSNLNSW